MSPPKMALRNLPDYLKKRIEIGAGRQDKVCWCWTGKVKKARRRLRPYSAITGDGDGNGYREHASRYTNEAAVPLVRHPITRNEEDARRHVYGAATMVPVCDVPTLTRCCDNPRCVSPHHVIPGRATTAQRKLREAPPETPAAEAIDIMAILMAKRPVADGDPDCIPLVEEECGLPAGSLTWPKWVKYVEWASENPEDDDDC